MFEGDLGDGGAVIINSFVIIRFGGGGPQAHSYPEADGAGVVMKRPIENNSKSWPLCIIEFSFSGLKMTIIAAEMTGRVCHAIEISPAYIDVAIIRCAGGARAFCDCRMAMVRIFAQK